MPKILQDALMVGLIAVGIPDAPDWMFECEARHFTGKRRLGLGAAAESRGNLVNSMAKGVGVISVRGCVDVALSVRARMRWPSLLYSLKFGAVAPIIAAWL